MPKLVGVALYVGGVGALAVLAGMLRGAEASSAVGLVRGMQGVFWFALAPGAALASLCGLGLLALHGRVLLAMRWLQVKLALLVVGLPVIDVVLLERLGRVSRLARPVWEGEGGVGALAAMRSEAGALFWVSVGVGGLLVVVMWLGRHKPRLGQSPAAAHRRAGSAGASR